MSIIRRLARPLLAASFIASGIDAVLHPMAKAETARPLVDRLAPRLGLPEDPETFVRGNGALMAGAGVLFALGRLPRLSSLVLAATLVPTAYTEHAFWQEKDPQVRRAQLTLFLKDAGLMGGALLAVVDTAGKPGLAWRGRHAVHQADTVSKRAARQTRRSAKQARTAAKQARTTARQARTMAKLQARDVVRTASAALPG
jgi:putative oxidoreductase